MSPPAAGGARADRIDASRAALIVYDACRRAMLPGDPARRAAMRPVLDAWVRLIGACRARSMPIVYTTPVSRADGADVVLLPTDLSVQTGVPSLNLSSSQAAGSICVKTASKSTPLSRNRSSPRWATMPSEER